MNKAKILFGQSYYLRFDPKLWEAMQPYPPLGTMYAASYLRERGYQVAIFDAMLAESENAWQVSLDDYQPDYAVLFEDNFNYLSKMCLLRMREAAYSMIRMAKSRGVPVIVSGADPSDHFQEYLARGADYVLIGEGEETLSELLDNLSAGGVPGEEQQPVQAKGPSRTDETSPSAGQSAVSTARPLLGLAFVTRDDSGRMIRTPRRPDIKELDALPFPAWDLIDVERYRRIWLENHGFFSMNMVTTRGCPYHCNWCAKPIWGQRYNVRSPDNVASEIQWLADTYHPDHIWFADDIFGLKPGWLPEFAAILQTRDIRIPYKCLSRVDLLLRSGEIEALKSSSAEIIWVGAESGSQKILNAMEKGTRVDQIYQASDQLRGAGIKVGLFIQFGYPGETREDIESTLQMVRDIMPDDIGMSVSYPLPGTKFYERVVDQMGDKKNWYDSDDLAMMYTGPFSTDFYRQLHTVLHKEFRMRKNWGQLKRTAVQPKKLRPSHIRQATAMVYQGATLPLARLRLNRLQRSSPSPSGSLKPDLTLEEASSPSPQN